MKHENQNIQSWQCGDKGDNVIATLHEEVLTISGAGNMYKYWSGLYPNRNNYPPWRFHTFYTVIISDGVTNIGQSAFYFHKELTSVKIADSVTSIDSGAFMYCKGLTSIIIPDGVASIGRSSTFYGCSELTSINIPKGITSIGDKTFYDCIKLTSINIPDSVTSIENEAFYNCANLVSINIPDGVTSIGYDAFRNCAELISINIPDSVVRLAWGGVFQGCYGLTSVTIGSGVTSFSDFQIQSRHPELVSIDVSPNNPKYSSIDGVLFVKDQDYEVVDGERVFKDMAFALKATKKLLKYPANKKGAYTIPNGVAFIEKCAFEDCRKLTSITINNDVTSIDQWAFDGCSKLNTINFNADNIHTPALFSKCTALTTINIGNDVKILKGVFSHCTELISITIPNNVLTIGIGAFSGCKKLISVIIGNGVTSIGSDAFNGCDKLIAIEVATENTAFCSIDGVLFSKDKTILIKYPEGKQETSVVIPDGVTTIGEYAFSGCKKNNSIVIPNSVTTIGNSAFSRCEGLSSVIIPNNVATIGDNAFSSCKKLNSITIGNSVTFIGGYAFQNCDDLISITCLCQKKPSLGYRTYVLRSSGDEWLEFTTFDGIRKDCYLYVPREKIEDYRRDSWKFDAQRECGHWAQFTNIEAIIHNVILVPLNEECAILQTVDYNAKAILPNIPTRAGYVFDGWYSDMFYNKAWNFDVDVVIADTTLYAKWTPVK